MAFSAQTYPFTFEVATPSYPSPSSSTIQQVLEAVAQTPIPLDHEVPQTPIPLNHEAPQTPDASNKSKKHQASAKTSKHYRQVASEYTDLLESFCYMAAPAMLNFSTFPRRVRMSLMKSAMDTTLNKLGRSKSPARFVEDYDRALLAELRPVGRSHLSTIAAKTYSFEAGSMPTSPDADMASKAHATNQVIPNGSKDSTSSPLNHWGYLTSRTSSSGSGFTEPPIFAKGSASSLSNASAGPTSCASSSSSFTEQTFVSNNSASSSPTAFADPTSGTSSSNGFTKQTFVSNNSANPSPNTSADLTSGTLASNRFTVQGILNSTASPSPSASAAPTSSTSSSNGFTKRTPVQDLAARKMVHNSTPAPTEAASPVAHDDPPLLPAMAHGMKSTSVDPTLGPGVEASAAIFTNTPVVSGAADANADFDPFAFWQDDYELFEAACTAVFAVPGAD